MSQVIDQPSSGKQYAGGGVSFDFSADGVTLTRADYVGETGRVLIDWRTWFLIEERVRWFHAHTPSRAAGSGRRRAKGSRG